MDRAKFEANGSWSEMVYFNAEPGSKAWQDVVGRDRLAAPQDGRFDLFSRELHALYPDADEACMPGFSVPQTAGDEASFPFLLVTQRLITQSTAWQGTVPSLQECYGLISPARWDSWVEINPRAAEALGIKNGDTVVVESPLGRCRREPRLYEGIWPNAVFLPPGQGHVTLVKWGRDAATGQVGANVNRLLANAGVTRARVYKA